MKLAVMQPYLFPYLGYFQLIRAVDAFVVYDDVHYMKGGWINRNHILANGDKQRFTLPLRGASPSKLINQVEIEGPHKILQSMRHSYGKAPHFNTVYPIIEEILAYPEKNLARFLDFQLRRICDALGLYPRWHISSSLEKDNGLRGQDKVLAICKVLKATHYINLPGGMTIYDRESFARAGMQLSFIEPKATIYRQFGAGFVPRLSIIDVLMFNDQEQCARLLEEYRLV